MQFFCLLGVAIHASAGVIAAGFHVHPHQLRHTHAMQAIRRAHQVKLRGITSLLIVKTAVNFDLGEVPEGREHSLQL